MADTTGLSPVEETHAGSTPAFPTVSSLLEDRGKRELAYFALIHFADKDMAMHSCRVAIGHSGTAKVVALLHDIMEDTRFPEADLRRLFCAETVRLVMLLTRQYAETYVEYIDRVATDPMAVQVKLSDIQDNLDRGDGPSTSLKTRYRKASNRLRSGTWEA